MMFAPNGLVRRCFFPGEENGELPGFVGGFDADKFKNEKRRMNEPGIYLLQLTQPMQPLAPHVEDTFTGNLDGTGDLLFAVSKGKHFWAEGSTWTTTAWSPTETYDSFKPIKTDSLKRPGQAGTVVGFACDRCMSNAYYSWLKSKIRVWDSHRVTELRFDGAMVVTPVVTFLQIPKHR